jgi:hypothetical protein
MYAIRTKWVQWEIETTADALLFVGCQGVQLRGKGTQSLSFEEQR